ncbi:Alcohol dehydrogenase 3 [Forsythia ovata]|uniref:Alcohol dehydrogenase 3 n=1 Tax=Forsythia ovata TaxID=205694 RepID=A0ABD1VGC8_9LAMI
MNAGNERFVETGEELDKGDFSSEGKDDIVENVVHQYWSPYTSNELPTIGVSAAVAFHSLLQLLINTSRVLRKSPVIPSRNHAWLVFAADQVLREETLIMSRPVLLVFLLLILIITSQFEWRQQLVSNTDLSPRESQKQQQISKREESDKEKLGPFLGAKHAARVMIPNRGGTIITTASTCSTIGGVASHAYTSSKHGVVGLTKNIAVELGKYGIRVNCVSPHLVATSLAKDFFKLDDGGCHGVYSNLKGVVLKPEDAAEAALFLASDESKYVSGHNLLVDGGFTIVNPMFCMFE